MHRRTLSAALTALALIASAVVTQTGLSSAAGAAAKAPITQKSVADPGFSKFGSGYYVYGTGGTDADGADDGVLPIFSGGSVSKTFTQVGNAFDTVPAGYDGLWAPHVVARDGYYFMFFTASYRGADHCIYWSVSSRPTGGFGTPHQVVCGNGTGYEAIDPTIYRDASGTDYVVWKRGHFTPGTIGGTYYTGFPHGDFYIQARQVSFTGARAAYATGSASFTLATALDSTVMEAPSLFDHGGKVWLFVSRSRFDTNDYRTDAWSAPRIGSGFRFSNSLMRTGQGYGHGPGGAEVIQDGATSRIAYHYWDRDKPNPQDPGVRLTRISTLSWPGGKPHVD